WEHVFTYIGTTGGAHHDGMEFVAGHLWLADMFGDWILQYTPQGDLMRTFYHPPLGHDLEGMGFGAFEHFWSGSFTNPITGVTEIVEFGGGTLQLSIRRRPEAGLPIYISDGCILNDEVIYNWDPIHYNLDPNGSIHDDPLFVGDYFLTQIAAGQLVDSNCVDAGSDLASNLGMDTYTTRTDSVPDQYDGIDPCSAVVDMGYHHRPFTPTQYRLTTIVTGVTGDVLSPYHPTGHNYNEHTQVVLSV
ncbi:unnamed protein product, partial [marine sediment metagenome]